MNLERLHEILDHKEICNVYYEEKPVWIQDIKEDVAHIGFLEQNMEKDVYIEDLYEDDLYRQIE